MISVRGSCSALLAFTAMVLVTGCDASQLAQLESALNQGTTTTTSGGTDGTFANGSTCYYTETLTYDLGPGINTAQSFVTYGSGNGSSGVRVTGVVNQSDATGCAQNTMLPAVGETRVTTVYSVSSQSGVVRLYTSHNAQPTQMSLSGNVLSMNPAQISNGQETQTFDQGSMQAASFSADAQMVIQVTYTYSQGTYQ